MSKLKKNEPVKSFMVSSPTTINEKTSFSEAAKLILEDGLNHLPVVSGSKLVGMFSNTDLMRVDFASSFGGDQKQSLATLDSSKTILEVCSKKPETIGERDTAQDAARKIVHGNFHALPVVDDENNLIGMVTTTDLIKFLGDIG